MNMLLCPIVIVPPPLLTLVVSLSIRSVELPMYDPSSLFHNAVFAKDDMPL